MAKYAKTENAPTYQIPLIISVGLTVLTLAAIQLNVTRPMILAERFGVGFGWVEIVILGCYAGVLMKKMSDPRHAPKWRLFIWRLFSIVFFSQLILGLSGMDRLLMTGKLHLPIPAVILTGPLYRGEGFFMPILFFSTLLLVGPAWCSHLCYLGAWDNTAANQKKRPSLFGPPLHIFRVAFFCIVIIITLLLRFFNIPLVIVITIASMFGAGGILVMVFLSQKKGQMIHCIAYCPIGLLANIFGKISPFRIAIDSESCSACMRCGSACRYNALKLDHIKKGKPGLTCALCGDCLNACDHHAIQYQFTPWIAGEPARKAFLVMIIVSHTVFLGVARI